MSETHLRVLLTADPYLPVPPVTYGGIERIVHGLAQELRSRGHSVGLVAHPDSLSEVEAFFPWPSSDCSGAVNVLRHTLALCDAARAFHPDVVHSFSRLLLLLPLIRGRGARLMSYQRDTGGWRNRVGAAISGASFAFTGCSEYIASRGRRSGGRWEAIPNFADVEACPFSASVGTDAPLVFLSRIESIKGAHMAIQIAQCAGRKLILAGNRVDTPEGREYWSREIEPRLEDPAIEYVGAVDDSRKYELLGRAAALLVPIEWDEPFGIVFAEALACGTPVISCPRGALPEIVAHGENGFLVRSVEQGAAAVARLGEIDRAACRRIAEQKYSRRTAGDAYLALYRELLSVAA